MYLFRFLITTFTTRHARYYAPRIIKVRKLPGTSMLCTKNPKDLHFKTLQNTLYNEKYCVVNFLFAAVAVQLVLHKFTSLCTCKQKRNNKTNFC